jgi:hypothetical protein
MAVGISAANVATIWLNWLKGAAVTTKTANATYVELHTADPGAAGTTAVSVGSTTRLNILDAGWTSSSGGSALTMTAATGPWTNGGTPETVSHIAVFSAASAGTFYFSVALTTPQPWASGNTFTLNTLTVALTPLAA